jgi:hypothetical protein
MNIGFVVHHYDPSDGTGGYAVNLVTRLARHHDDVDGMFHRWVDVWCSESFRPWSIVPLLPSITYCRRCQGRLLEVDETCRECGNPIWTIRWMTQAD